MKLNMEIVFEEKLLALFYFERGFYDMRIQYKDFVMNYGDDEYINFKRIGDWVNKEWN